MSHLSVFRNFWESFFKHENAAFNGEQEKESIVCVGWDRKSVPRDHNLSSLGKPRDAKP